MKLIHFPVITNINSPKILIYQDSWGSTIKMAESPYQPNEGIKKVPNRLAVLIISVKILTSNKCASSVMLLVVLSGLVLGASSPSLRELQNLVWLRSLGGKREYRKMNMRLYLVPVSGDR